MPETEQQADWRLIDHTADIRIQIWGRDLPDLFNNAAKGLTSLLGGAPEGGPEIEEIIELESGDIEELLVDWLREILYRNEALDFCFMRSLFERVEGTSLRAGVIGTWKTEDIVPEQDIKAVTYHGVNVTETEWGFEAKVVLDI
jgi:SHS2 domain-containing protein